MGQPFGAEAQQREEFRQGGQTLRLPALVGRESSRPVLPVQKRLKPPLNPLRQPQSCQVVGHFQPDVYNLGHGNLRSGGASTL